jgi:acetyl esterase/lipase
LRSEVDAYLAQLRANGGAMPEDLVELRDAYAGAVRMAAEQFPAPELAGRSWAECRTPDGDLRVLVQRPVEAPTPALVYFHGGGFVLADPEATEFATASLALGSGATVLSVDYRLAPEHPYPAAFDDARRVLDWVRDEAEEIGIDASRIAIGGDSSGGALAVAAALEAGRQGRPVDALLLFYPWLDMTLEGPSMSHLGPTDAVIPLPMMEAFRAAAFGDAPADWSRSDLLAEDLSLLPDTFIAVGGADPLLSDSERLLQGLRDSGVDFEYHCFGVEPHGFFTVPFLTDAARAAALAGSFAAGRLAAAATEETLA